MNAELQMNEANIVIWCTSAEVGEIRMLDATNLYHKL